MADLTEAVNDLSDGRAAGARLGNSSSDKIALWGKTPIVQPASASQAAVTATVGTALATTTFSQVATSGKWGFSSSTVAKTFQPRINQLRVDVLALTTLVTAMRTGLVNSGVIKGAA